jgi:TonB family protein
MTIAGFNASREIVIVSPAASRRQRLVGISFPGTATPVEINSDEDAVIHREGWIIGRVSARVPSQLLLTPGKHTLEFIPVTGGLSAKTIEVDPAATRSLQITLGSDVIPAVKMIGAMPAYTEQARRDGVRGNVRLSVRILANGSVAEIRVIEGLGHGLDELTVQAVRQWRFRPAIRNGQPTDTQQEIAIPFPPTN